MNKYNIFNGLTSKNYKAFLLFLILTFILWFAIQLTKTYNYQNEIAVEISDIPKHIVIDTTIQFVSINTNANGLKQWTYNLTDKVLKIPFNKFERDSSKLFMATNNLKYKFSELYEIEVENINFNQTSVQFEYYRKQTKTVAIKPDINYSFSSGYNTLERIQLKPDSVVISGSKEYLDNIEFVYTQNLVLNEVSDTLKGKIKLKSPSENIEFSRNEVAYSLPVEKYSENAIMVDIQTINVPDSLEVNIFPNEAKISFLISLKSFEKVSAIDFKVICDYKTRYSEEAIMIPKLDKYPVIVINPKLHVKKVDYIIKQKS